MSSLRIPENPEAECEVIGGLLRAATEGDTTLLSRVVNFLSPGDFNSSRQRRYFQTIANLHRNGRTPDLVTVTDSLREHLTLREGDAADLADCLGRTFSTALIEQHARIVKRCAIQRAIISRASDLVQGVSREPLDMIRAETHALDALAQSLDSTVEDVILTPASSVPPEAIEWAWENRIAFGTSTLVVGDVGLGKTTLLIEQAARWTRGQLLGAVHKRPIQVLIASAEDLRAATLVPRLIAAGADLDRVQFIDLRADDGSPRGLVLPYDLPAMRARVQRLYERAVIITDPLVAHLPGEINSWRDQDVRRALAPLARLAEATGIAVIATVHLNKASATDLLRRVGGSVGITAWARSIFLVALDQEDGSTRLFAHGKSNLSLLAQTLRFGIEDRTIADAAGRSIPTSGIAWLGESGIHARDLLRHEEPEDRSARTEAMAWLRDVLAKGPRPAAEIQIEARKIGIADITLRRAKDALGIRSDKSSMQGPWTWALPDSDAAHPSISDHLEHVRPQGTPSKRLTSPKMITKKITAEHLHQNPVVKRGLEINTSKDAHLQKDRDDLIVRTAVELFGGQIVEVRSRP